MDELIDKIEELTELNTQLKTANAELEKQVQTLLELEEEGENLKSEVFIQKGLNATLKRRLDAMTNEYDTRLRALDSLSKAAAGIDPAAIEKMMADVNTIQTVAEGLKNHTQRYFYIYVFLVACMIGIGGIGLWRITQIAKNVNDVLYLLLPK